ncbi:hypothetical protein ACVBEG_26940 [Pseudomonas sp. GG8]
MGLTICAAFELEFYLIDQENVNGRPQSPRSPISWKPPGFRLQVPDRRLDMSIACKTFLKVPRSKVSPRMPSSRKVRPRNSR